MQPIVNELKEQYAGEVDFRSLNALDDGEGTAAFQAYALRGHPSIVMVEPGGRVSSTHLGIVSREELVRAIEEALGRNQ